MIREKLTFKKHSNDRIRWRCHEPLRLETFSDAVFAFALTLIVVSIEVPKSFTELTELMKGTISFAMCFVLLFMIWNSQNIFFRRYGINDRYTVMLNAVLLFISLIYVYPLKFLTTLFYDETYIDHGHMVERIIQSQVPGLMVIYGSGYAAIYFLFYLMYKHAEKYAVELELSPKEFYETKTSTYINLFNMLVGCLSIVAALILPTSRAGLSGWVYFLLPILYTFWYAHRGKQSRKMFGV